MGSSYVFMDDNAPSISCSNSVVAVQGSEMDGGVATTKSRPKSNRACLGHFRTKECYKPKNLRELEERIIKMNAVRYRLLMYET